MSVFTSRVTDTVPVADGAVTIRKLSPKQLQKAQKAQQVEAMADLREMGGPKFLKELQDALKDEKTQKAASNPLLRYDRGALLVAGIVAWTFDVRVGPDTIEDLDEDTQALLADKILRLSVPSLFHTAEEAEAATKNG